MRFDLLLKMRRAIMRGTRSERRSEGWQRLEQQRNLASLVYVSSAAASGGITLTQAGVTGVTWNLTSLDVSFAGPGFGAGAKLTIYDGTILGSVLYSVWLTSPVGSVGTDQKINLPTDALGRTGVQATPGNAMTIVVSGMGVNQGIVNARFTDGLP